MAVNPSQRNRRAVGRRPRLATALLLLAIATMLACGRKEPPEPPPSRIPAKVPEVVVEQRGESVIVDFPYPTVTIGGLPLETIEAIEIYELVREVPESFFQTRDEEDDDEGDEDTADGGEPAEGDDDSKEDAETDDEEDENGEEDDEDDEESDRKRTKRKAKERRVFTVDKREFDAAAQVRLRLADGDLAAATVGDRVRTRFQLNEISADERVAHIFSVKVVQDAKLISPYSNLETLIPKVPPPAPTGIVLTTEPRGVEIAWQSSLEAPVKETEEGAEADAEGEGEPRQNGSEPDSGDGDVEGEETTGTVPREKPGFEGFHVYRRQANEPHFGAPLELVPPAERSYLDTSAQYDQRYVYAVAAVRELTPVVESDIAEEREVDYRDRFAPPVPRNVAALAETGQVRLLWTPTPIADLAGYLVYRATGDGDERLLTPAPIQDSEYIDTDVASGARLRYYVIAIDKVGNRSRASETSETTVP